MEVSRNKQHDLIFQCMYAFLILEECKTPIDFKEIIALVCDEEYDGVSYFIKETLLNCLKHQQEIVEEVSKYLNKWKFERLNYCVQSILITNIVEVLYLKSLNKAMAINIAVKLTKKYADEKDYRFVNGVLENIYKAHGIEN